MPTLPLLGLAIVVFAATNIDDVLLLAAFFADSRLRTRAVVAGQFFGIGAITAGSVAAALATVVVPEGWVALLGLAPLALGLRHLLARRRIGAVGAEDEARSAEHIVERRTHSQVLAVAVVTVANGGDNLGVYIPLFAADPSAIPVYVTVFAVMTGVWCGAGYALVNNRWVGERVRRYGHRVLPFVLIALGLYILSGIRMLF